MAITTESIWLIEPRTMNHYASVLRTADVVALAGKNVPEPAGRKEGRTAVIPISGPLTKHLGFFQALFGGSSYTGITAAIQRAASDPTITKIVLDIDSPGGTVDGVQTTAQAIREAAKVKPVVAYVDGMAASAGYWLASQATQVFAGSSLSTFGSIGVRMTVYDYSEALKKEGIRVVTVDTGPRKSIGVVGRPISKEDEAYLQQRIDETFSEFQAAVKAGRKLSDSQLKKISDGSVFHAREVDSAAVAAQQRVEEADAMVARLTDTRTGFSLLPEHIHLEMRAMESRLFQSDDYKQFIDPPGRLQRLETIINVPYGDGTGEQLVNLARFQSENNSIKPTIGKVLDSLQTTDTNRYVVPRAPWEAYVETCKLEHERLSEWYAATKSEIEARKAEIEDLKRYHVK